MGNKSGGDYMSNQTFFHGGAGDPNRPVKGNTTFLNGGVEDSKVQTNLQETISANREGNKTFFHGGVGDPNRPVEGNTTFINGGAGDERIRKANAPYSCNNEKNNGNIENSNDIIEMLNFDFKNEKMMFTVLKKDEEEGLLESIITAPFKAIRGVGDYLLVDQEKEGREAGIKFATEMFKPILLGVKKRYEQLDCYLKQLGSDYEKKTAALEKMFIQYKMNSENLTNEIEVRRKESSKAKEYLSQIGYFFEAVGAAGSSGTVGSIGVGLRGSAIAASGGLAGLASPLFVVPLFTLFGGYIDKRNQEKFQKYFNIAYKETADKYQSKVDREKNKIHQIIQNIKAAKKENADRLDQLDRALQDVIQEHTELISIYTTVRGM